MTPPKQIKFQKITKAILYLQQNFKKQPSLDEIAQHVQLSPFHFQRLFTEWAGTSPKKFLQYISLEHAKKLLKEQNSSLLETSFQTGLSGPGRLHDLFITLQGMTPGEYKNGGTSLIIHYHFASTPFGPILLASTSKGICSLTFVSDAQKSLNLLKSHFPKATFVEKQDPFQKEALSFFHQDWTAPKSIQLHLKGTPFQLKVWEALLKIPSGGLSTYGHIAQQIHKPKASRAVGTAIGSNPVAFLIPCHRVIQSTGFLGHYHWGSHLKTAMIGWEGARVHEAPNSKHQIPNK